MTLHTTRMMRASYGTECVQDGHTAVILAAEYGALRIVQELLQYGAHPDLQHEVPDLVDLLLDLVRESLVVKCPNW